MIGFSVVARFAGNCDALSGSVLEIGMTAYATSVDKAGPMEVFDELPNLAGHRGLVGWMVNDIDTKCCSKQVTYSA